MHYVYVLRSLKTGRYYIGSTEDLTKRLERHNSGKNKSTKIGIPWFLEYKENFPTEQDAYRREMQIKRFKGGEAFKKLLK
jgi:putative endonuclease